MDVNDVMNTGRESFLTKKGSSRQNASLLPIGAQRPASTGSAGRWYVVHTRPSQETRAKTQLSRQGFTTFLPTFTRTIRHSRQFRTSDSPLFPRYLFIRFDVNQDRWRSVNSTLGVSCLITAGEKPLPVPRGAIEEMLSHGRHSPLLELKQGSPVRVVTGPFAGIVGKLVRLDAGGRVRVLLSILGGDVPVSVETKDLVPTV